MSARRLLLLAAIPVALSAPAGAAADTVQVNTTVDENNTGADCGLREAVVTQEGATSYGGCTLVAAPGTDQITFAGALTGATISLSNDQIGVNVANPLEIVGPGMGSLTISADIGSRVFNAIAGTATISGMTIRDGAPNGAGGAVRGGCVLNTGTLTLTDVRVTNCEANVTDSSTDVFSDGGGIGNLGTLTLNGSVVDANEARGINTAGGPGSGQARGAGIYSETGALTINDSTIADNEASATDGGTGSAVAFAGIALINATATISQSTFSGNVADATEASGGAYTAGAIYTNAVSAVIEQSTLAGNIADPNGTTVVAAGGIFSQGAATTIRSSTIALNGPSSASFNGASLNSPSGVVTIANTVIADPRGGLHNCADIGNVTSAGFNDDYSPGGASCFDTPLASDQTANPLLATAGLTGNGGPTETIALQASSPMIDAGSNVGNTDLTTDQRGLTRPVDFPGVPDASGGNGTDIGALEVQQQCAGQSTPATVCPGPPTPVTPVKTGKRAKALKKCKKIKSKKKRKKCRKKAKKKPV